jgi:glutaredoxin 1/glutaredoxin 3
MDAKVYSTSTCTWCDRVVKNLTESGIEVEKIDISGDKKLFKQMSEDVGKKVSTVPQVIVDDVYIGGYTETERFIKNLTVSS